MQTALRTETMVLPGHRVEISDPTLPEGVKVEVIVVLLEPTPRQSPMSVLEFVKSLPPGPRCFDTWEEYEQFLREEKESWER